MLDEKVAEQSISCGLAQKTSSPEKDVEDHDKVPGPSLPVLGWAALDLSRESMLDCAVTWAFVPERFSVI